MALDRVLSWVTLLILVCGSMSKNHARLSSENYWLNPRSLTGGKTGHKPSSYAVNEPPAVTYEPKDQIAPISLLCNEKNMILTVKADFYNNGIRISTDELLLGQDPYAGASCKAFPSSDVEYVIEAGLYECGTLLTIEEDSLVYSNVLRVSPEPIANGIVRTSGAVIPIACHYQRRHVVNSQGIYPTWAPFTSTVAALDLLDFSLKLMAADWRSERSSKMYASGELLQIEASVRLSSHVPLRIFMDTCIATKDPDVNSQPRYAFIQNHGCLYGAQAKGSLAQLMPRSLDEKLQVKMDAFVFPEGFLEDEIYITCQMKVTAASQNPDTVNKACSYVDGWWRSADGEDGVCRCCDSTCQGDDAGVLYTLGVGPIIMANKN